MKNLFSLVLFVVLGLLIGSCITSIEASSNASQTANSPKGKVTAIYAINQGIQKDTIGNAGLCDTCHTSYKSAIIENRILSNQISAQNYKMSEIIQKNEVEIAKLELVAGNLVKLRKRYELDIANIEKRMQNDKIFYTHAQPRN